MSAFTFYLIRHGMTAGNELHQYIGRTDEPLSSAGREALLRLRERDIYPPVTQLFSSPMKRARQTAALLYPDLSPVIIEEFRESDFGRFEGKSFAELSADAAYMAWVNSGGTLPFPDGEPEEVFRARVIAGLSRVCEMVEDATPAALILHGGVIMTLCAALLSEEIRVDTSGQRYLTTAERQSRFSYMVKNGGVLTLSVEKEGEKWFNCSVN